MGLLLLYFDLNVNGCVPRRRGLKGRTTERGRKIPSFLCILKQVANCYTCSELSAFCSRRRVRLGNVHNQIRETLTYNIFFLPKVYVTLSVVHFKTFLALYWVWAELPNLANKNTERRVQCEFQINTKQFLSVSMSQILYIFYLANPDCEISFWSTF